MVTKLNENNEPTMDEYKVYKITENKWQLEENKQTLNELLPIFTKNINNMLNKLMGE